MFIEGHKIQLLCSHTQSTMCRIVRFSWRWRESSTL